MWWKTRGATGLHALLMEHWDPIGVRDIPEAQGEYTRYLGEIATRLHNEADSSDIAEYLSWAQGRMGLPKPAKDLKGVARTITGWYAAEMAQENQSM